MNVSEIEIYLYNQISEFDREIKLIDARQIIYNFLNNKSYVFITHLYQDIINEIKIIIFENNKLIIDRI